MSVQQWTLLWQEFHKNGTGEVKIWINPFLGLCNTKILSSFTSNMYMTAEHLASTQPSQKYILHLKNCPLFQLISCPNHMPSLLHLYAFVYTTALFANMANHLFSKPLEEQFTPSQQYPGLMLNLFGGGSGPLYIGFSIKRYVKAWQTIDHSIYFSKSAKKTSLMLLYLGQVSFKLKGQKYLAVIRCFFLHSIAGFTNHV